MALLIKVEYWVERLVDLMAPMKVWRLVVRKGVAVVVVVLLLVEILLLFEIIIIPITNSITPSFYFFL
jgi:hypothetical protein